MEGAGEKHSQGQPIAFTFTCMGDEQAGSFEGCSSTSKRVVKSLMETKSTGQGECKES